MCIIVAKPIGVDPVSRKILEKCWERNPDGGGVVWFNSGSDSAYMKKGMMNKERFLKQLDKVNKKDIAFIAHFRIKSRGSVCPLNTHPFNYEHITFAHNGTLSNLPSEGDKTDSQTFGDKFFVGKTIKWIKASKDILEFVLGYSKFAVMDNLTGEIVILNKQLGKEEDGVWYSNDGYKETTYPTGAYKCNNSLPLTTTSNKNVTSTQIESGYVSSMSLTEMLRQNLGTPNWSPNLTGIVYDKVNKWWKNNSTGIITKPIGFKNITYSREGLYKIDLLDTTGCLVAGQESWVPELRKLLWASYTDSLDVLRRTKDYDETTEAAEQARTYWLVANAIHRMISSGITVSKKSLDKCIFGVNYKDTGYIKPAYTLDLLDILPAIRDEVFDFIDNEESKAKK